MPPSTVTSTNARPQSCRHARATVRYRCAPATIGKVHVDGDHELQHAWIANLSTTGVGLALPRPIPTSHEASLLLRGNDGATVYDLAVRVMHCTQQPHHDWLVGCELVHPLTLDELDNLL